MLGQNASIILRLDLPFDNDLEMLKRAVHGDGFGPVPVPSRKAAPRTAPSIRTSHSMICWLAQRDGVSRWDWISRATGVVKL